jgi:hypothetical protein
MTRCPTFATLAAALVALALLVAPARSLAQTAAPADQKITAIPKGTVGLGLIGMELGLVIPALAGARDTWAYIVFPIAGAGGGAAAGYFLLDKGSGHPELAVASLVTGMALLIPALVLTIAKTAYEPEEASASAARASLAREAAAGPGLVRWTQDGVRVLPPGVSVGSLVSPQEALRTGATQARLVHTSLVSGVF